MSNTKERAPVIIAPRRGFAFPGLTELWRYRSLVYYLTWRDFKVRYKQTLLGMGWALAQPVLSIVVFSVVFGRFAGLADKTAGVPYPVFVFSGLLPWQLLSKALTASGRSIIANNHLVRKIYFPRLALPVASVGPGLVDFMLALVVLAGLMLYYGTPISYRLLALPLLVILTLLVALAVGVTVAALSAVYRDLVFALPFLLQLGLFLTPVIYPVSLLPSDYRWVLALNPATGIVAGFRWTLLGAPADGLALAVSATLATLGLLAAMVLFRRAESSFADWV